jgi:glycosyltransferase involved in cell wall biosynthesis
MATLATDIYADSRSQRDFLVKEGIIKSGRVLASGSVNGVDCERFRPDPEARKAVRQAHGIAANTLVYGFLGRLSRDKGLYDLIEAFAGSPLRELACLLLVGPDEGAIEEAFRKQFPDLSERVHLVGYTSAPERYYAAFDVFCLPSYREGFGSSVIEAAACGVPALASRIYGLEDAVEEGVTGILHAPKNVAEIRGGLERYAAEPRLMRQYGAAARRRAKSVFSRERLVRAMTSEYERLLSRGRASV